MNKMYESLEELMQKTLHRSKATLAIGGVKGNTASGVSDDLEKLEKLVVDRIGKLKGVVQQAEALAADEARRSEQLIENLRANVGALEVKVKETEEILSRKDSASQSVEKNLTEKIALLEAQLRDTKKIVHEKESTVRMQEQRLNAKIKDLESQLRANEKILAGRHAQIVDLQSQLKSLTHGIKEMSSFFRQAEALAVVEAQGAGAVARSEQAKGGEEKPATSQLADSPGETVPPGFFDDVTRELTEVLGPIASMVIRDHVASFGESMGKFPKARVPELLQIISQDILDEDRKVRFRERLAVTL
jgi:chromosome segregation ATPase